MRGAERSFVAIAECWPDAPIFTTVFDSERVSSWFPGRDVSSSFLQRLAPTQQNFRRLLPLYPLAAKSINLENYDLVVSSSSAFAHGMTTSADATHICYCYTPFRYAWHERERALSGVRPAARPALKTVLDRIKRWDLAASETVTKYVSISEYSSELIHSAYGRESSVVYPPVEISRFAPSDEVADYFLFVGEVVSHKRIEIALRAARRANKKVRVVGNGPDRDRLEVEFADVVEFVGRVSDEELNDIFAKAYALVVPNVEEFGIAAVEAQAAGRPVLALDKGGTRETILDGETGVLVQTGSEEELAEAMRFVDFAAFSPTACVARAKTFSTEQFKRNFQSEVAVAINS